MLGDQPSRPTRRRHHHQPLHAGRPLTALTRVGLIELLGQWRRQTCAIERLIRRLEGRQVAVTGLGGSVVWLALGDDQSCAALVSGLRKEERQREGVGYVKTFAGTDGPCEVCRD